jgi:CRISPR-associated protein (TIGR02584 family)
MTPLVADPEPTSAYSRRILFAVTGLSPQVVTETVYALATGDPAHRWVPTEIQIATTLEGAERARLALLSDSPGWFRRLAAEYGLPDIRFDESSVHTLHDREGRPLPDIRSPEDNLAAADLIVARIRELTSDPDSAVHVSIAGGRKTMGFYAGYALTLFGRPQDRLSHVLVSEPFESSWEFFYPALQPRVVRVRESSLADASQARVTLAMIPFVSLRDDLPESLLSGQASFEETVEAARASRAPRRLQLDATRLTVNAAGREFRLPPSQFALLAMFAFRAERGRPPIPAPLKDAVDHAWSTAALKDLRAACGTMLVPSSVETALTRGVDGAYFSQHLSRLQRNLRVQLGPAARAYMVQDGGGKPRRYRLGLLPGEVAFIRTQSGQARTYSSALSARPMQSSRKCWDS